MARQCFDHPHGFTVALKDGETIDFRPVKPDDWEVIQNGMYHLSRKSRYFRFFTPVIKLTDSQLHYFSEVDQQDHVAWIAVAHDQADHPGVGIARFIRFKNDPEVAEFAVTVIDKYQKRGLGTLLMAILYLKAHRQGVKILRGFVLPENTVATHWLERLGACGKFENDLCQMDLAVCRDLAHLPTSPLLQLISDHRIKVM